MNGNTLRIIFAGHDFLKPETNINVDEFSVTRQYRQNQMAAQLFKAFSLITEEKADIYRRNLEEGGEDNRVATSDTLFKTFAGIIREETGGEIIDGKEASGYSHMEFLDKMYESMGIEITRLQKTYNPTKYIAIKEWLENIRNNSNELVHHIARMEVFENIAKPFFDKMADIYKDIQGDKRFIEFHQMIEGSHGEKNDDMTDLYMNLYPEKKEELEKLIESYTNLRSNVLDEFANMK